MNGRTGLGVAYAHRSGVERIHSIILLCRLIIGFRARPFAPRQLPTFQIWGYPGPSILCRRRSCPSEIRHSTTEARVIGGSKAGAAVGVEEGGTRIVRRRGLLRPGRVPHHLRRMACRNQLLLAYAPAVVDLPLKPGCRIVVPGGSILMCSKSQK